MQDMSRDNSNQKLPMGVWIIKCVIIPQNKFTQVSKNKSAIKHLREVNLRIFRDSNEWYFVTYSLNVNNFE